MKVGPQGWSMGRVHEGVHRPDVHVLYTCPLRSIALNYRERTGPAPPKAMLRTIRQPKERDDIVITKLDKGSDVVVMDKTDYVHFLILKICRSVGITLGPLGVHLPSYASNVALSYFLW